MKEYRIVRNNYDGRGWWTWNTYGDMFTALKVLGKLELLVTKGIIRIEERDVSPWYDTTFEVKAHDKQKEKI